MKNKLKVFLCLLFAVVVPFSFVGCGDKSNNDNGSDAGQNSGANPPAGQPEQGVAYVLNEAEAVRILGSSDEVVNAFVATLNNNSELLKNNNYTSKFGTRVAKGLNYSYYPKLISDVLKYNLNARSQYFEFGKVYFFDQNGTRRFIEMSIIENNLKMEIVSWDLKDLVYFNFDFKVNNGEIESLKISQLIAPSKAYKIEFLDVTINIKNSSLKACFGNLTGFSDENKEFFNEYFTKEKFSKIPSLYWATSSFQQIELPTDVEAISDSSQCISAVVNEFDNFGFLNVISKYEEYTNSTINHIALQDDIFGTIDMNPASRTTYNYNSTNFTFDKNI